MTISTRIMTRLNGRLVGSDQFGNRYYTEKRMPKGRKARRWVLYAGVAEPSTIPPEWHGWMHYTVDVPPTVVPPVHHRWQKPPQANLSGLAGAYLPSGHLLEGGKRARNIADYQPWKPK